MNLSNRTNHFNDLEAMFAEVIQQLIENEWGSII